jgi:hypothetical protein
MFSDSTFALLFRLSGTGAKFLLLLIGGQFLDVEVYIDLAALIAVVLISVFILGFDFYTFVYRRIIFLSEKELSREISAHLTLILSIIILLSIFIFISDFDDYLNLSIFTILSVAVVELLAFEVTRYLQAKKDYLFFSFLLGLRSGGWCAIILFLFLMNVEGIDLYLIAIIWLSNSLVVSIIGFVRMRQLHKINFRLIFDYNWLRKGFIFAFPYWIASISFKALTTSDKILVESTLNTNATFVYVLSASIGGIYLMLSDTIIYSKIAPYLVETAKVDREKFSLYSKQTVLQTVKLCSVVLILVLLIFPFLSFLTGRDFIYDFFKVFFIVQIALFLMALSFAFHHINYANEYHRYNQAAQVLAFIIFFAPLVFFEISIDLVSQNLFGASITLLIVKAYRSFI